MEQQQHNQLIKLTIKQLLTADAHIGHSSILRHPQNISQIFATYQKKDLINLEKTLQSLVPTLQIMINSIANYETLLIIAQHPSAKNIQTTLPTLTTKWVHGALSNFKTIKLSKKINFFQSLPRIPNIIILVHTTNDQIILNEIKLLEIPVIALRDTTNDSTQILYPIPTNHTSDTTIKLFLKFFTQASFYGYAKNVLTFKQSQTSKNND